MTLTLSQDPESRTCSTYYQDQGISSNQNCPNFHLENSSPRYSERPTRHRRTRATRWLYKQRSGPWGLRSEKAVSAHLLLENAYESNLVSDISSRLSGRRPGPHAPTPPPRPSDVRRRRLCIWLLAPRGLRVPWRAPILHNREDSSAKHTIARISTAVRECMGTASDGTTRGHMQANIVHIISQPDNAEGGAIRATVFRIEYDTGKKAQAKCRELYPATEPAGLFVGRRVRNPYGRTASLPAFGRLLLAHGYGIYCIDYTQDFSTGRRLWTTSALPKVFASKATWRPPRAQTIPRYWRTPIALGAMSAHGCA